MLKVCGARFERKMKRQYYGVRFFGKSKQTSNRKNDRRKVLVIFKLAAMHTFDGSDHSCDGYRTRLGSPRKCCSIPAAIR